MNNRYVQWIYLFTYKSTQWHSICIQTRRVIYDIDNECIQTFKHVHAYKHTRKHTFTHASHSSKSLHGTVQFLGVRDDSSDCIWFQALPFRRMLSTHISSTYTVTLPPVNRRPLYRASTIVRNPTLREQTTIAINHNAQWRHPMWFTHRLHVARKINTLTALTEMMKMEQQPEKKKQDACLKKRRRITMGRDWWMMMMRV